MCYFVLLVCLLSCVFAENHQCEKVLHAGGESHHFDVFIGHMLHTITIEDVRRFDPNFPKSNSIPTINRDLSSNLSIINHIPSVEHQFETPFMRGVDDIFNHMGDKSYILKHSTVLEQIAHEAHMQEMWANVLIHYQHLKRNQSFPDKEFCKCALDVEKNGILAAMQEHAEVLRHPEPIVHESDDPSILRLDMLLKIYCAPPRLIKEKLTLTEDDYALTGIDAWNRFKEINRMMAIDGIQSKNMALFVHCLLSSQV